MPLSLRERVGVRALQWATISRSGSSLTRPAATLSRRARGEGQAVSVPKGQCAGGGGACFCGFFRSKRSGIMTRKASPTTKKILL